MSTVIYPSPIFGPVHSRRLGVSLGITCFLPMVSFAHSTVSIVNADIIKIIVLNRNFLPAKKCAKRWNIV